jgi:peptidyl-tRNA hydrolase
LSSLSLFIKLRYKLHDKYINGDGDSYTDKDIDGQHPSAGKTGIGNQPVENKIVRYILGPMGESDENKIKHQQKHAYCHEEQAHQGNKQPVMLEDFYEVINIPDTDSDKNENY